MKKIITILLLTVFVNATIKAQVGIGTSSPDASAALDISSTDKGLLMPRMSTDQRNAIAAAVDGLMVFDTDTKSLWTYIDSEWKESEAGVGKFVEGAAADIAYYDGRVGIGRDDFATIHRMYVDNVQDASRNTSAVIRGVYSGTGNAEWVYGSGSVARNNSTGTVGYAIGSQSFVENPSGTISNAVAAWPQLDNSADVTWGSAIISEVYHKSGTMGTGRAENLGVYNSAGASMGTTSLSSMYMANSGTVTGDAFGLWIGGASTGTVAGNSYALYIATPFGDDTGDNVAGDRFALYSDNTANSYMEGNLGVGTNDPQQKVHISGVLRLEPQATPPAGAGLGDLYAGDDNKLYFHDGTSWKEIQLVTP